MKYYVNKKEMTRENWVLELENALYYTFDYNDMFGADRLEWDLECAIDNMESGMIQTIGYKTFKIEFE